MHTRSVSVKGRTVHGGHSLDLDVKDDHPAAGGGGGYGGGGVSGGDSTTSRSPPKQEDLDFFTQVHVCSGSVLMGSGICTPHVPIVIGFWGCSAG